MKSLCVLDDNNNETALANFARKLLAVLGGRVVLMTDGNPQTQIFAERLENGLVQGGGTVFCLQSGFESRVVSASRMLEADGAVYLYSDCVCRMSVYGANGRSLTEAEEREIARATPETLSRPGCAVALCHDEAYTSLAYRVGGSFENVAVSFSSPNDPILRFVRRIARQLGAVERKRPVFYLSRSGLKAAAQDERGRMYTHERLLDLCSACELRNKKTLSVPLPALFALTEAARRSGAELVGCFDGGCEPWQTDGVMLALRLLHHMSESGLSLAALFDQRRFPSETRTVVAFDGSLDRLADCIVCEEAIAQGDGFLFLKRENAGAVLTKQKSGKRCCVEVQSYDAETARELCEELEQAILTYSNN